MKAAKWGSPSQYARFRAGWMSPFERRREIKAGELSEKHRCETCRNRIKADPLPLHEKRSHFCRRIGYATINNAVCNEWGPNDKDPEKMLNELGDLYCKAYEIHSTIHDIIKEPEKSQHGRLAEDALYAMRQCILDAGIIDDLTTETQDNQPPTEARQ